jgi:hypothetical protein
MDQAVLEGRGLNPIIFGQGTIIYRKKTKARQVPRQKAIQIRRWIKKSIIIIGQSATLECVAFNPLLAIADNSG